MIIDIVYGYPGNDSIDNSTHLKFRQGGCVIDADSPSYFCKSCCYEFGGLDKFLNDEFINDDL